jgi:predicted enzyme related to lactoylglutathione lyase
MAQTMAGTANKPAWVDLSSSDPGASRDFYAKLFGWQVDVNPDPLYGGYAIAKVGGHDAAGIGSKMDPNAPTAWNLYIGTNDIAALARRVTDAGGTVAMAPFDVGDQGQMAVFRDPAGGSSRPGRARAWAASRRRTELVRLGGSTPAASTGSCRSTRRSSAGRPRTSRWTTAGRTRSPARRASVAGALR